MVPAPILNQASDSERVLSVCLRSAKAAAQEGAVEAGRIAVASCSYGAAAQIYFSAIK